MLIYGLFYDCFYIVAELNGYDGDTWPTKPKICAHWLFKDKIFWPLILCTYIGNLPLDYLPEV